MWLVACLSTWVLAARWVTATVTLSDTRPLNQTVPESLFYELEELSRLVSIAYCVGNEGIYKPFKCLSHCDSFPDFELVETWNLGLIDSASCGYIALAHSDPKRIIVAFRGSNSLSDAMYDLMTQPAEYAPFPGACTNCTVHSGFWGLWQSTRDLIMPTIEALFVNNPSYELVLTGHSLGGAIAGLAGLELKAKGLDVSVTTFGEPRFGNAELATFVDSMFDPNSGRYRRVTHVGDPVPLLPFERLGWQMHASEVFVGKEGLPAAISDVRLCEGRADPNCIAGPSKSDAETVAQITKLREASLRVQGDGFFGGVPGFPAEWRLWEILFAHRHYFWRIGLCWDPQNLDYSQPKHSLGDEL